MHIVRFSGENRGRCCGSAPDRGRRTKTMTQPVLRVVEGVNVDKTKALDAALSQIERAFGKGSIMRLGKNQPAAEIETVSTGSLGLEDRKSTRLNSSHHSISYAV